MTIGWREQMRPGVALREIVTQATASLIAMDAERLEELALCCADLNRDADLIHEVVDLDLATAGMVETAAQDLRLLDRVLYESRANLAILTRLHQLRLREIQAGQRTFQLSSGHESPIVEVDYGDN